MTKVEKIENIMKSNLSDEMKEEMVKLLFNEEKPTYIPYQINYPNITPYLKENKPWWDQITCETETSERKYPETWNDDDWYKQHMRNAQADVESILHPFASW